MDKHFSKVVIGRIRPFLNRFCESCDRWRKRFLPKMLSSIVASGGLVVTDMARYVARAEGKSVDAAWQQMREHLKSSMWSRWEEESRLNYARWIVRDVPGRRQVIVDLSDLSKPYAQGMELLDIVRDADESSLRGYMVTNPGYWEFASYVLLGAEHNPVALTQRTYSIEQPTIGSENRMYHQELSVISEVAPGAEVIIDRGGDRPFIMDTCRELKLGFIIRQVGLRIISDMEGNRLGAMKELAEGMALTGEMSLRVWSRRHRWEWRQVHFGFMRMRYGGYDGELSLVVCRFKYGEKMTSPVMLLTDRCVVSSWQAFEVIKSYTKRWRAEDAIRFLKSALSLESIRIHDFVSIQRLIWLAFLVMSLLSLILNEMSQQQKDKISRLALALKTRILLYHYRLLEAMRIILHGRAWQKFLLGLAVT